MHHTKGPWKITGPILLNDPPRSVEDVRGKTIALITDWDHTPKAERVANARLIAACPTLLEALLWMVDIHDNTRRTKANFKQAVRNAKMAIAKALGE